jgi:Lsr2
LLLQTEVEELQMAQKVQVTLVDDMDGTEAEETVRFSVDRVDYEIDLSKKNAAALRDALAPYVGAARRVGGRRAGGARRGRSAGNGTAAIRDWAKAKGYKVSDRGRVPANIVEEYNKAHG